MRAVTLCLGISQMADPMPDGYRDGCTVGPQRFGKVWHDDICDKHDDDWWHNRTVIEAIGSNFKWAGGIIGRHGRNGWWIIPAALYAVAGLIFLNTAGWYWWARK